jgi:hypothetical protein
VLPALAVFDRLCSAFAELPLRRATRAGQAPALKEARPAGGKGQSVALKKPGHAQGSITERYIHAVQVLFPGAAEKAERRLFVEVAERPR